MVGAVVVAPGGAFNVLSLDSDIYFRADYRFDAFLFCLEIEFHCAEHVAVVGYGYCSHAPFFCCVDEFIWSYCAVKKRIHGVVVEMYEAAGVFHLKNPYVFVLTGFLPKV